MGEDNQKVTNIWVIFGGIVILCAIANPFLIMLLAKTEFTVSDIGSLGALGDFFGGTTVGLLSLASILFVIHTIAIQSKELSLQRKELSLTRKEFEISNNTAKIQKFENSFFNMLSLLHQVVNNIKIRDIQTTYSDRAAINRLRDICVDEFALAQFIRDYPEKGLKSWRENSFARNEYMEKVFGDPDTIGQEEIDKLYKDFHDKYGDVIGHYMRFNYRIVKFIVNNVANDENEQKKIYEKTGQDTIIGDRRYYLGMLRAQWSNAEFELILINSLYSENHKFKNLIIRYDVLDMEDRETNSNPETFKLKESMSKFKAYRKLIEVRK